ncbi:MAG: hypothetical protein Q8O67_30760 [Deltaproteobacteria bacterium]|nr:hypothetical protein [Deltaproteobacteria bacterium]
MFVVVAVCALLGHLAPPLAGHPHPGPAIPVSGTVRVAALATDEVLKQAAQKARDRFLEGDFQGAIAAVDALHKTFEAGPAFRADDAGWNAWADSRLTRALALRRLGKEDAADDELRALAVVRPTFAPDASFAPPKVVTRFQELREQLLSGPTVAVTVEVAPAGGVMVLDGRPMPPGVLDVLPGTHWFGVDGVGQRVAIDKPRDLKLKGPSTTTTNTNIDDGPGPDVVIPPVIDPPPIVAEDGPPWLWIGVGAGAAALTAVVVAVVVVAGLPPPVANPGGTTFKIDASALDDKDGP